MPSTLTKKIIGTVAMGTFGLGAVALTVPGVSAMAQNGVQVLAQQAQSSEQGVGYGYGSKPNCVNGEHIDRGNNKNQGNGGCSKELPSDQ